MYDRSSVLQSLDANAVAFAILFGGLTAFMFAWFWLVIRKAARERQYSVPIGAVYFWLAHDGTAALGIMEWPGPGSHWFIMFLRCAFIPATVLDAVLLAQIIAYGRGELAPWLSQRVYAASILAGAAFITANWLVVMHALHDDLHFISMALTIALPLPLITATLWRRHACSTLSPLAWTAYTAMVVLYFASTFTLGGYFHSWPWILLAAVSCTWGIVLIRMIYAAPPHRVQQSAVATRPPS
ncbi:hypothetical protein [Streptomyces spiramyceticus]|uniref:hypothetical protein n=1 Tax=Streptomyces spiramyceticus TaxID=299717 RepID=UPI00237B1784|nr:hypothetical protein [Streptomyces spiramyceticus]